MKMGMPKGKSGNPKGRPKKGTDFISQLREALKTVSRKQGKTLCEHLVERAYIDDMVLVAVAKKILPDQVTVDDKSILDRVIMIRAASGQPMLNVTPNAPSDSQDLPRFVRYDTDNSIKVAEIVE